jgi:xanthine dehydrogenase large subunit
VSEVEVNGLTGSTTCSAWTSSTTWGDSLIPTIDRGQIEGAFVQGLGWLTTEELVWTPTAACARTRPDTYKIPAMGDVPPEHSRCTCSSDAAQPGVIHGSKAVGEPPLMLAISVSALREAVAPSAPRTRPARAPCIEAVRAG